LVVESESLEVTIKEVSKRHEYQKLFLGVEERAGYKKQVFV